MSDFKEHDAYVKLQNNVRGAGIAVAVWWVVWILLYLWCWAYQTEPRVFRIVDNTIEFYYSQHRYAGIYAQGVNPETGEHSACRVTRLWDETTDEFRKQFPINRTGIDGWSYIHAIPQECHLTEWSGPRAWEDDSSAQYEWVMDWTLNVLVFASMAVTVGLLYVAARLSLLSRPVNE